MFGYEDELRDALRDEVSKLEVELRKVIDENQELKANLAIAVEALEFVKSRTHSDPLLIAELNVRAARVYEAVNKALKEIKGEK